MGTWDSGPFDNDTAADWRDGLDDASAGERAHMVRDALVRAVDTDGHLEAPAAEEAVAAAALVTARLPGGGIPSPHYGPKEPLPGLAALRPLALRALDRVVTEPSELLDLWEDSGGGPWRSGVERMRRLLLPPPEGEQLSLY
ncbi:DUF4259 domain-containing protein [Streptomyces sp. BK340]|uniref:DUF4259 domain-containing protein n=1 Tax=Streptomyces sp. BK340 TaxID=2572903 RepID=UPI0011AAEB3F|nr:DUF4259 domain-containing protein [Streptomyces sp. BK340]TVZ87406.1 uncharacterized protein DUF4259 [Streptomyces sp. BK340]